MIHKWTERGTERDRETENNSLSKRKRMSDFQRKLGKELTKHGPSWSCHQLINLTSFHIRLLKQPLPTSPETTQQIWLSPRSFSSPRQPRLHMAARKLALTTSYRLYEQDCLLQFPSYNSYPMYYGWPVVSRRRNWPSPNAHGTREAPTPVPQSPPPPGQVGIIWLVIHR